MASANDLIRSALFRIGASSDINPASAEMLNESRTVFEGWLREMALNEIYLGVDLENYPAPTDPLGNVEGTDEALINGFAVRIATTFQIPLSVDQVNTATKSMNTLYALSLKPDVPSWPSTLPKGAGNQRGTRSPVFYPKPEFVDEYNPDNDPPPS